MHFDKTPKPLPKEFITHKFHDKIENMVNAIRSRDDQDELEQFLDNQLELPEPQLQLITPQQSSASSTFQQMIILYLKSRSKETDPVFDLFQIVQDILSRYKKSISCQRLQEINKQLYEIAKNKQSKSSKRLNSTCSDYSKSTSNIMDLYLLQIQQLNQKIKQFQETIVMKDKSIRQLQFKIFSIQSRTKKQSKIEQKNTLLNPCVPTLQASVKSSDNQQSKINDLQVIAEQQDESLEVENMRKILPIESELIQESSQIKQQNDEQLIKIQQNSEISSKSAKQKANSVNTSENKATQSQNLQNAYNLQFQIHSLNLQNLKLQKQRDALITQTKLSKQQINILKQQKDYYFKQLKAKHSEIRKSHKIIQKLINLTGKP